MRLITRKIVAAGLTLLASGAVALAPAKKKFSEVAYAKYRIYQQMDANTPRAAANSPAATFLITRNPDAAVVIQGGTEADQTRLVESGDMKRCMPLPPGFDILFGQEANFEQGVVLQRSNPSGWESATAGIPDAHKLLTIGQNMMAFKADISGLPMYMCLTDQYQMPANAIYY